MNQQNKIKENNIDLNKNLNQEVNLINCNENCKANKNSTIINNTKLDDLYFIGKHTLIVCFFVELMILCQLSNMLYISYAGFFFLL